MPPHGFLNVGISLEKERWECTVFTLEISKTPKEIRFYWASTIRCANESLGVWGFQFAKWSHEYNRLIAFFPYYSLWTEMVISSRLNVHFSQTFICLVQKLHSSSLDCKNPESIMQTDRGSAGWMDAHSRGTWPIVGDNPIWTTGTVSGSPRFRLKTRCNSCLSGVETLIYGHNL